MQPASAIPKPSVVMGVSCVRTWLWPRFRLRARFRRGCVPSHAGLEGAAALAVVVGGRPKYAQYFPPVFAVFDPVHSPPHTIISLPVAPPRESGVDRGRW